MINQEMLGVVSIILGCIGYWYFLVALYKKTFVPHALTWSVFACMTWIAYFAQRTETLGPATWVTLFTALVCTLFACIAFAGDWKRYVVQADYYLFAASIVSLALWYVTSTPLYSVILITVADLFAYLPMIRKAYSNPETESLFGGLFSGVKFIPSIMALDSITIISALYPISLVVTNGLYVLALILGKRRV